ncbi:MAG: hypothetical protein ABI560_18695, partial [Myxococcales bacterium]
VYGDRLLARLVLLAVLGVLPAATLGCASTADQERDARYPRRGAGCELAIYHTAVPGVPAWDDLGVAEVACHISDPAAECLRRLRNESCRMGGDIIYNVPHQPLRPRDQVLVYRGQVAHSRAGAASTKTEDADLPPPASPDESAGPVVPLPSEHVVSPAPMHARPSRADPDAGVPDADGPKDQQRP